MKKNILVGILAMSLLGSCNKDKDILNTLNDYNLEMEATGYHFGETIKIPASVAENAEKIAISFGDKETEKLEITPEFFTLGDNSVTFVIYKKNGETLQQDATINVFASKPEQELIYEIVAQYPHNPNNFVQGFQLEGNTIYESDGQNGASQIIKYQLGSTAPQVATPQPAEYFSEGATIVGDKVYQLTWRNKKGFIYDKTSLNLLSDFDYPPVLGEGWGLTYNGEHLIASDGTKNLYFLNPANPSELVRYIAVAGSTQAYDKLNELEYHEGYIYANVWQKPIVIKIDPKTGEVVAKIDFSEIASKHTTGSDDVLNGIAFKGSNMLITGKMWDKTYEISVK